MSKIFICGFRTERISETLIQAWAPERLTKALDAEAARRMMSRATLVRLSLAKELGLLDEHNADQRRELESKEV